MWHECLSSQSRTTVSNTLLLGAELHDCRMIRHGASASFLWSFMVLETAGSKADFLPAVRVCAWTCFSKRHLMWKTGVVALSLLLHFAGHLPSLKSRINSTLITQVHCANSTVFTKLRVVVELFWKVCVSRFLQIWCEGWMFSHRDVSNCCYILISSSVPQSVSVHITLKSQTVTVHIIQQV